MIEFEVPAGMADSLTADLWQGRILLIGCSKAKRTSAELLPSLERYDGPQYRIVRKHLPVEPGLKVVILSGKFGLVDASEQIPMYDWKATPDSLDPIIIQSQWNRLVSPFLPNARSFGIAMGKQYLSLIPGLVGSLPPDQITIISGTTGSRLTSLKKWLDPSFVSGRGEPGASLTGPFRRLDLTELKDRAVHFKQYGSQQRRANWQVTCHGHTVGLKFFASLLTSIPASQFETRHAIQLAKALGLEVSKRA